MAFFVFEDFLLFLWLFFFDDVLLFVLPPEELGELLLLLLPSEEFFSEELSAFCLAPSAWVCRSASSSGWVVRSAPSAPSQAAPASCVFARLALVDKAWRVRVFSSSFSLAENLHAECQAENWMLSLVAFS